MKHNPLVYRQFPNRTSLFFLAKLKRPDITRDAPLDQTIFLPV
jgi:hypothetical protein